MPGMDVSSISSPMLDAADSNIEADNKADKGPKGATTRLIRAADCLHTC